MSQAASEVPVRGAPPAPSGGSGLSRKIGPLPAWGWLLGAAAVGVGFIWWRNHQAAAASTAASTDTSAGVDTSTDDAASIATLQSEIQQLQGEESTPAPTGNSGGATGGKVEILTVPKAETLSAFAKSRKWNTATLKAVEALNGLSASSKLKKGQRIVRPTGKTGEPT